MAGRIHFDAIDSPLADRRQATTMQVLLQAAIFLGVMTGLAIVGSREKKK